jgi:uncharacterized protein DUF2510
MDLPPSGWYPDPYGMPGLLRWWDGAAWSDHTYAEPVSAASTQLALPATTSDSGIRAAEATRADPGMRAAEATRADPGIRAAEATRADPGMQLAVMGPPTGPRTTPQPAIPDNYASDGTRVLSVDHTTWAGTGGRHAGGFGQPGYIRDERRRKILVAAGLTAGVAAACAVLALVVTSMNSSPQPSDAAPAAPATPATEAASASAAASPSATASPSPASTAMSSLADTTSGLTYGQLPAPWAPGCPGSLNTPVFTWAAGESAVAGQVNNGQTTWYGDACSGQLPAQYGYHSTADLQNVTNALANAFNGAYYQALPHNFQEVQSQPVSVSGHPGWEIKFLQTYTNPQGMAWTNELGAVVVADPGNGAPPAVFYVSVPGNLNEGNVDTLVSSLQLAAPAPPAATAPATPPSPGQGGNGGG